MKSVQERLLVIAYTAKSCFFSARSAPLLEEINTRMVKYADFARVDVDNPTFRQMCSEEVSKIKNLSYPKMSLPSTLFRMSPVHRQSECITMVRESPGSLDATDLKFAK